MTGIPAELISGASVSYDEVRISSGMVSWIEGRPDGENALVCWTPDQGVREVTPPGFSVASYVHEYGGGAYWSEGAGLWMCRADDQRLYRRAMQGPVPADLDPPQPGAVRYADMRSDRSGMWLWSVRERHKAGSVINDLVRIPTVKGVVPQAVASGSDFYSFPRPSPDGRHLAWTCWDAPQMPWDGTFLYVAGIEAGGVLGKPTLVVGSTDESIFQPEWSPSGILHFVSDRDGWWNLYAWQDGAVHPVIRCEAELGVAQWEFGYATYAFLDDGRIAVIVQRGAHQSLEVLEHGETRRVELPYTSLKPYISASGTQVALIASSPVETPSVIGVDVDSGNVRKLAGSEPVRDPQTLVVPESFSFTARDDLTIHGLFYPASGTTGPAPLVVKAHAGPTYNVPMRLDWHTQYLTSHGFAVAEVDYRGSTGYGRAFRNALRGRWGQADACDCADAAEYLTSIGKADSRRRAIWGASAGGYTALRAITITNTFAAAIARSPVIDPLTWKDAAPKFQAHHADALIGRSPEAYRQRSVLTTAGAINRPVLLLHGEADTITPAAETRALAKTLGDRARLLVFPDEGHRLRSPKALRAALQEELNFLSQALDILSK